jgi:DNA modification methylase/superfamily II DNA or RNA helicase
MDYAKFLETKRPRASMIGPKPGKLHPSLFPFQRDITSWAIRRGRAAIFADCGLGKTRMQIEWIRSVLGEGRGLIVAPLAVAEQTIAEAKEIGVDISYRTETGHQPIQITNYQRLHNFDPEAYVAVVLDESSILKSVDGKTRTDILKRWTIPKYRLACTATPAPNDMSELANHSEFIGEMTRPEMLSTFFIHDANGAGAGGWRLRGHAEEEFWKWMATWSVYVRKPSDIGDDDGPFVLPPLEISERVIECESASEGRLFGHAPGLSGERAARRASMSARVDEVARLIRESDGQAVVWCGLNDEGRELAKTLGFSAVLIEGATGDDERVAMEHRWRSGGAQTIITKSSMFGWGLNWQHCHRVYFLGIGHSYEQYYQSIRRCWRFGQKSPVSVTIVIGNGEGSVAANVRRKERDAAATADGIVANMKTEMDVELHGTKTWSAYETSDAQGDGWRVMLGDSVERIREIESGSVGLSVFSPPFAALYTYSASERDMGNSKDYDQFFKHFGHLIPELKRITIPGRRACVHVQQVSTTKATHGVIGWRDFRADVVRHFVAAGWIYDGEVVIDKDPQTQAIRTKAKALMFVQKNKDSAWSRPAMADYILLFRAPGDNPEPVKTDVSNEEWIMWARPIWYNIRESDTLSVAEAREEKDEKHVCPLQLETILRCVRLWSNVGDLVCDPFAGIGSTGYVALQNGRRFVGCELKKSYWTQATRNCASAIKQQSLFG